MSWGERSCHWSMNFSEERPCNPTMEFCNPSCQHYVHKDSFQAAHINFKIAWSGLVRALGKAARKDIKRIPG